MELTMAIHVQVLDAIAVKLRDMGLSGDPTIQVSKRFNETEALSHNTVYVFRSAEIDAAGSIGSNEIGYPAVIVMVKGTGGGLRENEEEVSDWRDAIVEEFHQRRAPISGIEEDRGIALTPMICRVDFGTDFADETWKSRWDINHLVIISYIRKGRTS
jgi:hypothetical protein